MDLLEVYLFPVDKYVILGFTYISDQKSDIYLYRKTKR